MKRRFDSATCPTCQTLFDRLPVEADEDGSAHVALETRPCATCGVQLCGSCSSVVCEHGDLHCSEHITILDADSEYPVKACPVCLEEIAASDAEPALGVCIDCELPVAAFAASVQRGGDVWHTACFNAMTAELAEYADEQENLEGFRHLAREDAAYPARRDVERVVAIPERRRA